MKKIILCAVALCLISVNVCAKSTKNMVLDYNYTEDRVEQLKKYSQEDIEWLARNIYFEARSESLHGRMVVAFVTLNRVLNRRWPDNIKDVVTQNKQFSWYNNRQVPPIEETRAMEDARTLAVFCINLYNSMAEAEGFEFDGITKGSDHYFADYIPAPSWAKKMKYKGKVGRHLLYKS
jgi:spore germination cell wall hydrolase CwlJ-like protein